ncbi:unnamed protein product [Peniophora sp. CBMAI 1063]|nr:unnamed protein product [Peniophora sp. CBMAI 1063]
MEDSVAIATSQSRFGLSESLKRDAHGAVKTAVDILGVAASMTQNVPYLGIISGALTEFLKIQDEVDIFKSDWRLAMAVAQQLKALVDRVRVQCEKLGPDEEALPEGFLEPLSELERCIVQSLVTLNACKAGSKRLRDRARAYLNRSGLAEDVRRCRSDMQSALELFNTKLHLVNAFVMHAHGKKLDAIIDQGLTVETGVPISVPPIALPSPPAIFHGRAQEVDHVVRLVLGKPPARVAILGSGGIGKTSIALAVLHHPDIEAHYGQSLFFMSCEAVLTAEGVLQELLKMFRLTSDAHSHLAPRDLLISHLRALPPTMLCMDNLETPWDADSLGVESLLADIASFSHIAVLIATRGGDRPRSVAWSQGPPLPQIEPLTLDAALETWDVICGPHDTYAEQLIKVVDLVPAKSAMKHYSQPHPVTRVQAHKPVQRMTMSEVRPAQHTSQHRIQRPELQQRAQAYQAAYAAPPSPNNFLLFSATSVEFPTQAPPATIVSPYARPSRVPSHIKGPSHSSFALPGYEKTPMSLHPYAAVSRALPDTPGSATSGDWRAWHEERGGWLIHA